MKISPKSSPDLGAQPQPFDEVSQEKPSSAPNTNTRHSLFSGVPRAASKTPSPDIHWRQSERVVTKDVPQAAPWGRWETVGYGLHALVWWFRRVTFDHSRRLDSLAVKSFLFEKNFWNEEKGPVKRVTKNVLIRSDIEKRFWWISEKQIQSLAEAMTALLSRSTRPSEKDLHGCIDAALFHRFLPPPKPKLA